MYGEFAAKWEKKWQRGMPPGVSKSCYCKVRGVRKHSRGYERWHNLLEGRWNKNVTHTLCVALLDINIAKCDIVDITIWLQSKLGEIESESSIKEYA